MSQELALQIVARGWCHPTTSSKTMDEQLAVAIAEEVQPYLDQPRLGLATTGQLLEELRARIEVDYFAGGGGLDYTTMHGRPETGTLSV